LQAAALTIYAVDSGVAVDLLRLRVLLQRLGLIDAGLAGDEFAAGPRFFNGITFLGCSPSIVLDEAQGENPLRISLHTSKLPVLFFSERARPPLCLHCKAALDDWKALIDQARDGQLDCPSCGQANVVGKLHYRKLACFSRVAIEIQPVFEREAVPDPGLLAALEAEFSVAFKYAYT